MEANNALETNQNKPLINNEIYQLTQAYQASWEEQVNKEIGTSMLTQKQEPLDKTDLSENQNIGGNTSATRSENSNHTPKQWSNLFVKLKRGRSIFISFSPRATIKSKNDNTLIIDIHEIMIKIFKEVGQDIVAAKPHMKKGSRTYLELIFVNKEELKHYTVNGINIFNKTYFGFIPTDTRKSFLPIKNRNVSLGNKADISKAIEETFKGRRLHKKRLRTAISLQKHYHKFLNKKNNELQAPSIPLIPEQNRTKNIQKITKPETINSNLLLNKDVTTNIVLNKNDDDLLSQSYSKVEKNFTPKEGEKNISPPLKLLMENQLPLQGNNDDNGYERDRIDSILKDKQEILVLQALQAPNISSRAWPTEWKQFLAVWKNANGTIKASSNWPWDKEDFWIGRIKESEFSVK
ncbi:28550_t:CDS:2, partial [Dentiscutata erythropus]